MLGLNYKLKELASRGEAIKVGIVGLGQMGLTLISHLSEIKGFKVCAVSDINTGMVKALHKIRGLKNKDIFFWENTELYRNKPAMVLRPDDILNIDTSPGNNVISQSMNHIGKSRLNDAIKRNKVIFTNDFSVLPLIEEIDVIIDATGYTEAGAEIALGALSGGKDVVTLNVETDVTVGPVLKKIAGQLNRVYTLSSGDEPAVLKELYDFADSLGFKIICAGKGKNNPLDIEANPETLADYAAKKGSSAKMMTTFVDGTKSMIEMACLSNATGLIPDCRGMHAPHADISDIVSIFRLKADGGILDRQGVVDFVIGNLAPGVFLVYSTTNKMVKETLKYVSQGSGPNYLIYKPYHLTSIETPLSLALAYFNRQPWIVPGGDGLVSEVVTVAKKDLEPGDRIDGIGGFAVYGLIELYNVAKREKCLPIGLSGGCILKNRRKKGEPVLYDDVDFPENTILMQLRKIQDESIQK